MSASRESFEQWWRLKWDLIGAGMKEGAWLSFADGWYRSEKARKETIVASAVQLEVPQEWREKMWNGKRVYPDFLTLTAPPPARHATLLHPLWDHLEGVMGGPSTQGFITSTGRYVDREEALKIALASGQPLIDHPSRNLKMLFSEDLWQ